MLPRVSRGGRRDSKTLMLLIKEGLALVTGCGKAGRYQQKEPEGGRPDPPGRGDSGPEAEPGAPQADAWGPEQPGQSMSGCCQVQPAREAGHTGA